MDTSKTEISIALDRNTTYVVAPNFVNIDIEPWRSQQNTSQPAHLHRFHNSMRKEDGVTQSPNIYAQASENRNKGDGVDGMDGNCGDSLGANDSSFPEITVDWLRR